MASDPRFDTFGNQPDQDSSQYVDAPRQRSKWHSCLMGCLIVMGIIVVLGVVLGFWVARNLRGWVADFGSQIFDQTIDSAEMAPQEKQEVKVQVERVKKAFQDEQISWGQLGTIMEKLAKSPLMPSLVVGAVEKQYFARSGLSDEEKAQGRKALARFASGAVEHKIDEKGIDAVMSHVADRRGPNGWQFRNNVTDQELRAAIKEAKSRADAAGVPEEPEKVDPSDVIKRIVDEELKNSEPQAEKIDEKPPQQQTH
jgi:hypothetical protein